MNNRRVDRTEERIEVEGRSERRGGGVFCIMAIGGGGSRGSLEVDARLFCQALVW